MIRVTLGSGVDNFFGIGVAMDRSGTRFAATAKNNAYVFHPAANPALPWLLEATLPGGPLVAFESELAFAGNFAAVNNLIFKHQSASVWTGAGSPALDTRLPVAAHGTLVAVLNTRTVAGSEFFTIDLYDNEVLLGPAAWTPPNVGPVGAQVSLAMDQNIIVAGWAPGPGGGSGNFIHVFMFAGGAWQASPALACDIAPAALDVDPDFIIVGSPFATNDQGNSAGVVEIISRSTLATVATFSPQSGSALAGITNFGQSVALRHGAAAVSGRIGNLGAVWLLHLVGGVWQLDPAPLLSPEPPGPGAQDLDFGYSLSLSDVATVSIPKKPHAHRQWLCIGSHGEGLDPVTESNPTGAVYLTVVPPLPSVPPTVFRPGQQEIIDPMAMVLSEAAYLIWVERHHPNTPLVAQLEQIALGMSVAERNATLGRARTLASYGNVVEAAILAARTVVAATEE
jgi:hypothetical protein